MSRTSTPTGSSTSSSTTRSPRRSTRSRPTRSSNATPTRSSCATAACRSSPGARSPRAGTTCSPTRRSARSAPRTASPSPRSSSGGSSSAASSSSRSPSAANACDENIDVFDFELTDEEMTRIADLDTGASLFFDHRDPAMVSWLNSRATTRPNASSRTAALDEKRRYVASHGKRHTLRRITQPVGQRCRRARNSEAGALGSDGRRMRDEPHSGREPKWQTDPPFSTPQSMTR